MRTQDIFVAILGVIGVVWSWIYFGVSTLEHGFVQSWIDAFTTHPFSTGLHIDLVLSDLAILSIAVFERDRIGGTRGVALTCFMGLVLGACAAIPTYWLLRRRGEREGARRARP